VESVTYEVFISVAINTQRIETEAVLKDNSDAEIYTPTLFQAVTPRTKRETVHIYFSVLFIHVMTYNYH